MSDNQRAGAARPRGSVSAASVVDVFALARQGGFLQGEVPLSHMTRAIEGLPAQPDGEAGLLRWSVRGEMGRGVVGSAIVSGRPLLRLHIEAHPVLICQRCSDPFVFDVDSSTVLQLVRSEDELDDDLSFDAQDPDVVDSLPEKVVGSHRFDLLAQVEDELILSIPYVPKHPVCSGAQAKDGDAQQASATQRPSPFAVLEQLKRKD